MVWIEVESQITTYRTRTFRGLADRQKVEDIINGNDTGFLALDNCYWYNEADDDVEEGKSLGTYQRLGHKEYRNFTGKIAIRCSTIVNVSYLKDGYSNEPILRSI